MSAELHHELKQAVTELCAQFSDSYWRELDSRRAYPEEFVQALTKAGYLATLIPEEYGGAGLGISEAATILEEIHRSGGNAGAELRLQAFGVSEPTTGSDTTQIKTLAVRKGDKYIVKGQKIWISRAEHSDLMLLVARTT